MSNTQGIKFNTFIFTPEWEEEWHGDLQFWDFDKKKRITSYPIKMGKCSCMEHQQTWSWTSQTETSVR